MMKRFLLSAAMVAALSASAQTVRPQYITTMGETLNIENALTPKAVMTRTIYQGYNTVCLPYSLSSEEVVQAFGEGVTLETPVGAVVENGAFTLCFADCTCEGIEAGKPYLLYSPAIKVARMTYNNSTSVQHPLTVSISDNQGNTATFMGSFERLNPVGTWAIPAVAGEIPANLLCCDGARRLNPTRCFFTWDTQNGQANTMAIKHVSAGEVAGLNGVTITDAEGAMYNTAGQRVNNAQRGVMIKNGRKVIH